MPQRWMLLVCLAVSCKPATDARAGELVLSENGQSPYRIVVAENASPSTKHGAEELQKFLAEMTGARLPIVSDQEPAGPREIFLGDSARFRAMKTGIDPASLGREGYVIRAVGAHLVIAGGSVRGNLYGVYGFLEDHLGCRWFTPDCSRIPKRPRLAIGAIDDRQVPALEYREPFVADCFDGDWCARNRMNSSHGGLDARRGGNVAFADGFFVHTFEQLVPPEKYFAEHPEYFAMIEGKRVKQQRQLSAQLCCTNPQVIQICIEAVREAMRAQPSATVFSVSQNDSYDANYCQCPQCQALAEQEDSQMGPVLQLVNHVAEAVEKEYPDKIIETLAYQWSQRPPKQMRPRTNVVIRLCSGGCCFSHPLAACNSPGSRAFRADLERWANVTQRLWVWDYVTDFGHYLLPFPNQRTRAGNVPYFAAHGVKGLFEQDTYDTVHGELSALGGYITAKCLWNPSCDANAAMNEFLEAYYGKAAGPIRSYIDLLHDHAERETIHVTLSAGCDSPHLNNALLEKANSLWHQAEDAVGDDPVVLARVKTGRLSVDYAILERDRLRAQNKLPASQSAAALARGRFNPFGQALRASGLTRLGEGVPLDKDAYLGGLAKELGL
ncbi:MAG: DUF4838 domain-containing protein [Pirellulales bacterium]|nr:DUF4838 domain-containing protein [Pirellulales bacterium]